MEQHIRFCTTADGVGIAYQTLGQGPALVLPPGWVSHLEVEWENPSRRAFYEALARHHTVVRYDRYGCGLSDRSRTDFSWEADLRPLQAVADHLKLRRFALLGMSAGGPVAALYAIKYPRRVSHLMLYGTYARIDPAELQLREAIIALVRVHWGLGSTTLTERFIPGGDAAEVQWFTRVQREAATAEMAAQLYAMGRQTEWSSLLPGLRVPTLVMHRQGDRAVPFHQGRELAAMIPNARFVPLEGDVHLPNLGDTAVVLRVIAGFLGDPVGPPPATPAEQPVAQDTVTGTDHPVTQQARSLIGSLDWVALSRFRVVGSYARYDEMARNALKDTRQKIAAGFEGPSRKRENHLIWAAPGSGKTYFIQQVAASFPRTIRYLELNLAKCSQQEFLSSLSEMDGDSGPCLCLVDEVDAKPNETWPYELLLPYLDSAVERGGRCVFVLAGSSGSRVADMKQRIASRPKGADLLSRIPSMNEYVIPPMTIGDRAVVVLSQFRQAGKEAGREIHAVEKLGLYYVALSPRLANARQLRELAVRAIERVPVGDDRVKYDHLFSPGDPENKGFWMQALPSAGDLVNKFVAVED